MLPPRLKTAVAVTASPTTTPTSSVARIGSASSGPIVASRPSSVGSPAAPVKVAEGDNKGTAAGSDCCHSSGLVTAAAVADGDLLGPAAADCDTAGEGEVLGDGEMVGVGPAPVGVRLDVVVDR